MKDDEDNEVLKIRSSCRQFRKKAEKNMASDQCTPLSGPFSSFSFSFFVVFRSSFLRIRRRGNELIVTQGGGNDPRA
jgi:hypothetical protein